MGVARIRQNLGMETCILGAPAKHMGGRQEALHRLAGKSVGPGLLPMECCIRSKVENCHRK